MLHLKLHEAAGAVSDLDGFFDAIIAVGYGRKPGSSSKLQARGDISLDPNNPYPKDHTVTAIYRGAGFEYDKHSSSFTIGGHTSNFVTWTFRSGRISSVELQLDGKPLLTEKFDDPYHAKVLPHSVGPVSLGVDFTGNNHANTFDGGNLRDILRGLGGDDNLLGRDGNDTLLGGNGSDGLNGGDGNDTLKGGSGSDALFGKEGKDNLMGGSGDDLLDGGLGADLLKGGSGHDDYRVNSRNDQVKESANAGTDTVHSSVHWALGRNVENLRLTGNGDLDGGGNSLANSLKGNAGANHLSGKGGNDKLFGGAGNDLLEGGSGDDRLRGGAGVDWLTGGSGEDCFVFAALSDSGTGNQRDIITAFASGVDAIDLSAIDGNAMVSGHQGFAFISYGMFSHEAGELRFADQVLSGDVDGDGLADFEIGIEFGLILESDLIL